MALQAASSFYSGQQERIALVLAATRAEWSKISKPGDFDRIFTRLLAILMAGQLGAATDGAAYVPAALAEQGFDGSSPLRVNPAAGVGWATDLRDPGVSRPLESLLWQVPAQALSFGGTVAGQMAYGSRFLDVIGQTQIADAGRMGSSAAIGVRVKVGYYRHVNPPCCKDCAVQAGRFFRHNAGFARHPHCDCVHVPAYEDKPPEGYTSQPSLDQISNLSEAQRKAVEDGASLSMVVNAERGATSMFTTEGTTKRGYYSYIQRSLDRQQGKATAWTARNVGRRGAVKNYTEQRVARARLTPEGIYQVARNQEEAVLLLIKNGYVVGDIDKLAAKAIAEMWRMTAVA